MHFTGTSMQHSEDRNLGFQYKFFCRIFSCIGLVFLFTTLVSPFWLIITGHKSSTNLGLWNICRNKSCRKLDVSSDTLQLTRVLMSLSTLSGLVAVVCAFLTDSSMKTSKWPLITNFFTGIVSLVTMLLYGLSINGKYNLSRPVPPTTFPVSVSWSFVMGCFACFLFLLNGLLFALIELQEVFDTQNKTKPRTTLEKKNPMLAMQGKTEPEQTWLAPV